MKNTHLHIDSVISFRNGQISNTWLKFKINGRLTILKLTFPCFLQLEGTRGVYMTYIMYLNVKNLYWVTRPTNS